MTVPTNQSSPVLNYQSPSKEGSPLRWLGWAIYLGMSWTWCIGMFLPVLLVREYGIWGWVVFALPNVIGAAAMGWVIKSRETSVQMVESHRPVMVLFSGVTAAFQIFFACWIFFFIGLDVNKFLIALFAVALISALLSISRIPRLDVWIAVVVWAASGLCLFQLFSSVTHGNLTSMLDGQPKVALIPLAMVCGFGFSFCPYLDLTFHRARQDLDERTGHAAFGLGFGVFFFAMIAASLLYASQMLHKGESVPLSEWLYWLGIYFWIQLAFTIGVHWSAESPYRGKGRAGQFLLMILSTLAGIGCWLAMRWIRYPAMESGEFIYRLFLGFYGLVFPAYVWLCMIPGRGVQPPTKRQLAACAIAIVIAAPTFWLGFIDQKMFWLIPGLAVVLLARIFLKPFRTSSV